MIYVTKMKRNLVYTIQDDIMYMTAEGKMMYRVQNVSFTKKVKDGNDIIHKARIITYNPVAIHFSFSSSKVIRLALSMVSINHTYLFKRFFAIVL